MPAGDGATRVVSDPTCEECGAQLAGEICISVDLWTMFTCHECAPEARETAPLSCTVFPLPRADPSDVWVGTVRGRNSYSGARRAFRACVVPSHEWIRDDRQVSAASRRERPNDRSR